MLYASFWSGWYFRRVFIHFKGLFFPYLFYDRFEKLCKLEFIAFFRVRKQEKKARV